MAAAQTDSRFVVFDSMAYGFRAFFILMIQYYRTYGLCTIRQIVSRYAPCIENNTAEYVASVSRRLSYDADARFPDLSESSATRWCDFALAVFILESGAPLSLCNKYRADLYEGWRLFAHSVGISTRNFNP